MSANVETMVSVREIPWHKLGTIVEDQMTAADALKASGLDWIVKKVPLFSPAPGGGPRMEIPDRFGIQRQTDGRVLGVVGTNYVPFQNTEAFQFFDNLVDSGDAKYETAGSLDIGRQVWIMATLPEGVSIGGVDEHQIYLLLSNRHDGSGSITAAVTPVRVVCQNTLNLALKGAKREWKVRHVSNIGARIQEARDALDVTFEYVERFQEEAEGLLAQPMSERAFGNYLTRLGDELDMADKTLADMKAKTTALFAEGETLENIRGTKWAALNAVDEWSEYLKAYLRDDPETHARSNWSVDGASRRLRKAAVAQLS